MEMNVKSFAEEVDSGSESHENESSEDVIIRDFPQTEERKVEIDVHSKIASIPQFVIEINDKEEDDDAYILADDLSRKDINENVQRNKDIIQRNDFVSKNLWNKDRNIELIFMVIDGRH